MTYTWEREECHRCRLYACCVGLDECRQKIDGEWEEHCSAFMAKENCECNRHYPLDQMVSNGAMTPEQADRCDRCVNFSTGCAWAEGMEDEIVYIDCGGTFDEDVCDKFEEVEE